MKDGIILYLIHFWQLFLKQQPLLQKQQKKNNKNNNNNNNNNKNNNDRNNNNIRWYGDYRVAVYALLLPFLSQARRRTQTPKMDKRPNESL